MRTVLVLLEKNKAPNIDKNTGSDDKSKQLSFRREATNVGHPSGRHIEVVCIARVFPQPPLHIQC